MAVRNRFPKANGAVYPAVFEYSVLFFWEVKCAKTEPINYTSRNKKSVLYSPTFWN